MAFPKLTFKHLCLNIIICPLPGKPVKITKIGSLQIEQEAKRVSPGFLIFQRTGLTIMCLVMISALLGLFGKGYLSVMTQSTGNLTVQYQKFIHQEAASIYRLHVTPESLKEKKLLIWIDQSLLDKLTIKSMNPEPESTSFENNKIIYTFNVAQLTPIHITMMVEPEEFGIIAANIGLMNGEHITLNQIIYP